ncbi:MAG: aminoacyl-tRNA deacylase [Chloroflexi bacterium]|nr:aminoacyl-tRNA deacylase [Chloroflexota bacterium]
MSKKRDRIPKTLAMRLLDAEKIEHEVLLFSADIHDAEEVARVLGVPPEQVYKTLVALADSPDHNQMLVMLAANRQLDLKKLAAQIGVKKAQLASHKEAEALTGLKVGGISALALLNKGFVIFIDQAATEIDTILVSAGQRGLDVRLSVADLLSVTGAVPIDVSAEA